MTAASSSSTFELSSEQRDYFTQFQKQAQSLCAGIPYLSEPQKAVPSAHIAAAKERGWAYHAVLSLVREGHFSEKAKPEAWLDLNSNKESSALSLATRYFTAQDHLNGLSEEDRRLCLLFHEKRRLFELSRVVVHLPKTNKSSIGVARFSNKAAKMARIVDSLVACGEMVGLVASDEKPMGLVDFQRLYPDACLDNQTIAWLLDKPPTPLSQEVVDHLQSRHCVNAPSCASLQPRARSLDPEVNSKSPATPHPLLKEITEAHEGALKLAGQLKKQDGQLLAIPDAKLAAQAEQVSKRAKDVVKKLHNQWQKGGEYYQKGMACAQQIAYAIYDDLRQGRAEQGQHFQLRERRRAFQQEQRDREQKSAAIQMSYREVEFFVRDQFQPSGFLTETLFDLEKNARAYREMVEKLQKRKEQHRNRHSALDTLSAGIDRNDQEMLDLSQKALKEQKKIAKALRHVMTTLRGAAAVVACAPGLNVAYGSALATASAVGSAAQEVIGRRTDRVMQQQQSHMTRSRHLQQRLGQIAAANQNELNLLESQLQQYQSMLFSHHAQFTASHLRKELQEAIGNNSREISQLQELQETYQGSLQRAENDVRAAKAHLRKKNNDLFHAKGSQKKKAEKRCSEAEATLKEKEVEKERITSRLETNSNRLKELEGLNSKTQKQLLEEQFLAPMKDQVEEVIRSEQARFDFDRHQADGEGVKAGDLTELGLAQRQMRISFARYNQARMQERQLVLGGMQALRGISLELSRLSGSDKPMMAVDLGHHLYHVYDQQKQFRESTLPQFQEFMKALQVDDGTSFMKKLQKLNGVELIGGFVVPGLQVVAAGIAAGRLAHALVTSGKQGLTPEQRFFVDSLQEGLRQQQQIFHREIAGLKQHLDSNQAALSEELQKLHADLARACRLLVDEIREAKKELIEEAQWHQWKRYQLEVDKAVSEMKARSTTFFLDSKNGIYNAEEIRKKTAKYCNKLQSQAKQIKEPHLNGRTITTKEGRITHFDLRIISRYPKYFSGLFAGKSGRPVQLNVPNLLLYKELKQAFHALQKVITERELKVDLSDLVQELKEQNFALENLCKSTNFFRKRVRDVKEKLEELVLDNVAKMGVLRETMQKTFVLQQVQNTLAYQRRLTGPLFVGAEKYFVSECINAIPLLRLRPGWRLDLNKLVDEVDAIRAAGWSCFGGKVVGATGAVLGFSVAGPFGLVLLGATGTAAGFATVALGTLKVAGLYKIGETFSSTEMWWPTFYDRVEARILHHMQTPLRHFYPDADMQVEEGLRKKLTDWTFCILGTLTFELEFCNFNRCFYVDQITYNCFAGGKQKQAIRCYQKLNNARPLLKLCADFRVHNLTFGVRFYKESLIQADDVRRIKGVLHPAKGAREGEKRLLTSYLAWLNSLKEGAQSSPADNPFTRLAKKGTPIPSLSGAFLPLLLPNKLVQQIERQFFVDSVNLMATNTGVLLPFFDFKKVLKSGGYQLSLHYRLIRENQHCLIRENQQIDKEDFCSFELATFDQPTVESFKKIVFQPDEKTGKQTYTIGKPNPQEFLLQALYAGYFNVGLPGRGTARLSRADLYIPNHQLFKGLFKLWEKSPHRMFNYRSSEYTAGKETNFFSSELQPRYGKGYLGVWSAVERAKRKNDQMKKIFAEYRECYYLCKGMYRLTTDWDPDECRERLELDGIFDPERPEQLYSSSYLKVISGCGEGPRPAICSAGEAAERKSECLD